MTNSHEIWNALLSPSSSTGAAKRTIESAIKVKLSIMAPDAILTTTEVANLIYPLAWIKTTEDQAARRKVFTILFSLAIGGLKDWANKSTHRKQVMGKWVNGIEWHRPTTQDKIVKHIKCPHCKRTFMEGEGDD